MGTRRLAAAVALLTAGLLVACGNGATPAGGTPPQGSVSATPTGDASLTPVAPPFSLPPSVPGRSAPSQPEQTITGQVEAGVERGCLVLHDPTGTYQLLGGDPTVVYAGANVVLTGHVVTGVMSYCMQGKPFQITQARRQ